ncbi:uncharacterized protein HMPREF1541_00783 [Cyphellophora europaea CBS 101466]|uniref:DUF6594 domain-containing protein n=1 Tax=Cyphellophora europaea (strain CBS 101466) TaxID=1220924 RepID=W2SD13_CYPE1|nr:uncharacterized protein HMPREF1541_00783 [Cyphellophora europaea CBS 101466]ETN46597.1 hypothetical protein HMPREF1541_00783 [Cyphellophora europaea CBS 101466]
MEGYARIAEQTSYHPSLGIYRRFAALNAQNILYLQAEIHELEADLRSYAAADAAQPKHTARAHYSRNWHKLARAQGEDRQQWHTIETLRAKLKEYNELLTQQALIARYYRKPRHYDLDVLRSCFKDAAMPDWYLLGLDSTIWDDPSLAHDLISLDPNDPDADDKLTQWISSHLVEPFHQLIGRHFKKAPPAFGNEAFVEYSDKGIVKFSSLLATVISSVFPVLGVIILFFVHDLLARIGIIAGLTAVFSFCLAIVTKARKVEIFAATAAFSAVLVVFLGAD